VAHEAGTPATGATTEKFRPERPRLTGTLNLPGTRASIQLWDVNNVAATYNPQDRSVSVIAELEVQGFLMHDLPERFDLAEQFDRVLGRSPRPGRQAGHAAGAHAARRRSAPHESYDTVRRVEA
jgi:hypothetical protein